MSAGFLLSIYNTLHRRGEFCSSVGSESMETHLLRAVWHSQYPRAPQKKHGDFITLTLDHAGSTLPPEDDSRQLFLRRHRPSSSEDNLSSIGLSPRAWMVSKALCSHSLSIALLPLYFELLSHFSWSGMLHRLTRWRVDCASWSIVIRSSGVMIDTGGGILDSVLLLDYRLT